MSTRLWGMVPLLAGVVAVSGCGAPVTQRPGPPTPAQNSITLADTLLTSDVGSLQAAWTLSRAENALEQQCMAGLGFSYLVPDPGPEPGANTVTGDAVGTGWPETYGVTVAADGPSAEDRYVGSLPPATQSAYDIALKGPTGQRAALTLPSGMTGSYQTGGCLGTARARLYGSVAEDMSEELVPQDVLTTFHASVPTDASYLAARQAWQSCMSAAGFAESDPEAAYAQVQTLADQLTDPAQLAARQQAIADADVTCDARSGLRARIAARLLAFLRAEPPALVTELAALDTARVAALAQARKVLA